MKLLRFVIPLLMLMLGLTACPSPTPTPGAAGQLPSLSGYTMHEGLELSEDASSNAVLNLVLNSDPRLSVVADIISSVGICAQEQGVVNWRVYMRESDPMAAGVVIIASESQATNPQVILTCTAGSFFAPPADLSPCSNNFRFEVNGETFYVMYGASKEEVCQDFQNALPPAAP